MRCQKCGGHMHGPQWQSGTNTLRYTCTCGFSKDMPARDAKDASRQAMSSIDRLRELLGPS